MMGLALFWVMQLHMSWVVLVPYVVASFYFQYQTQSDRVFVSFAWFLLGSMLTGSLLLPTFLKYALAGGLGGTDLTAALNIGNLPRIFSPTEGILTRALSFASFEIARFMGGNSAKRLLFIRQQPWLIPVVLFLGVVGILQPIALVLLWFSKMPTQKDWKAVKYLMLFTIALLYVSFLFSIKSPSSHTFYVILPIVMIYSFYCWNSFLQRPKWQKFAKVFLVCGIIFHIGLAINNFSRVSLYVDRSLPRSAIESRDFTVLGERRPGAKY